MTKLKSNWMIILSRKNEKKTSFIARDAAPLRAQAHLYLRDKIIRGDYKPGARIKERELIETLGVSRTVIREVIRQLETEKLITVEPQVGPRVRIMSASEAYEIYLIRATLEKLAVSLFIENQSEKTLKKLKDSFRQLETSLKKGSPDLIIKQKNKFFEIIYLYLNFIQCIILKYVGFSNISSYHLRCFMSCHSHYTSFISTRFCCYSSKSRS